jgi:hypothetical protein
MDPLWLLEKAYKKSRYHVGGEWQDQFRWCFGGDGGDGGGGGGEDSVDEGYATSQEAQDEADAAAAEAAEAAEAQSAAGRAGFEGWGVSGLPGADEAEDFGTGFIGLEDPETGFIDPASPVSDPNAGFSETFGITPGQAIAGLIDPSLIGLALAPLGLPVLGGVAASRGLSAVSDVTGLTGAVEEATGVDVTSGIVGQGLSAAGLARGGVVPLQSGIGSLYGRK